jgi:1,4-alpha-glucan branching enzyme
MNAQVAAPTRTQTSVPAKAAQDLQNARSQSASRSATKPSDRLKEVFFELNASSAKEVLLAGDFTDWEKTPIKLRKGEHGAWCTSVKLAPGQYHYRFVVDGQWQDDPSATAHSPNPFGTSDSVLEIS